MPENSACSSASSCTKESCEGCQGNKNPQSMLEPFNELSSVNKMQNPSIFWFQHCHVIQKPNDVQIH